ncbi:MAG: DUF6316 family protein [Porticoccaceae bacterium]|nr:DUF6316 family protein [Porticoccaceae bacterium]
MKACANRRVEDTGHYRQPRNDRYFCLDSRWYFTTREGLIMGPYESRELAAQETQTYIRFVSAANKRVLRLLTREKLTVPQASVRRQ